MRHSTAYPQAPPSPLMHQPEDRSRVFPVRVTRVNAERPSISVVNKNDMLIYDDITQFPAMSSSPESTDMVMPEVGQSGLGIFLSDQGGFTVVAILTWTVSDLVSNVDAIAHRQSPILEGFSTRRRGVHRKPYPGQRSKTLAEGYHSMEGAGWDRMAADLSQDRLDPNRRQWTQTTGRQVSYTDAGLRLSGTIQRPGADEALVPPETLPDGSTRQVVQLQESTQPSKRYTDGSQDVLPLSEILEKVQEFSLDYPVPLEILESTMLDDILGTRKDLWERTQVVTQADKVQRDDQSFLADQAVDHPHDGAPESPALGPTKSEAVTPRRRGWILERAVGTLVGYNVWDKPTYGRALKPTLWPLTKAGRFGSDVESGYLPVKTSTDHVETRLASSALMLRFPQENNTTRLDVTKEGMVLMEIGASLPKENVVWDSNTYEHPWGAGRSLEAHLVGSAKLVIGKNRDEEDSLDLTTLGQSVIRLGADDGSLPNVGRSVLTQNRGKADATLPRDLQYWTSATLTPGDAGSLDAGQKKGAENVSLRMATDGGAFLRIGSRDPKSKRRHLMNGYSDGQGHVQSAPGQGSRSRSAGRPTYGAGDSTYRFNDLSQAGSPSGGPPYQWSGAPVSSGDLDYHGLSLDVHTCRDIFLRVGKNNLSGQSILIDLEGGIVGIVGKDKKGRSLTAGLLGGIEMTVGANTNGQGIGLEIMGDVNMMIKGNWHVMATGDIVLDSHGSVSVIALKEAITKATNIKQSALVMHTTEAPEVVHNQGGTPPTGD